MHWQVNVLDNPHNCSSEDKLTQHVKWKNFAKRDAEEHQTDLNLS